MLTYSGFAASLALVVILLPSVTRVVEEVLRVVPAACARHPRPWVPPQWRTIWSVVLPTARSGVVTAVLLGIARIVGETAPLLFTAFGSQVMNWQPVLATTRAPCRWSSGPTSARPSRSSSTLAFQAAFVLMSLVLILFVLARIFSRPRGASSSKRRARQPAGRDDLLARLRSRSPWRSTSP